MQPRTNRPQKTRNSRRTGPLTFEGLETRRMMSAAADFLPAVQADRINPRLLAAVTDTLGGHQNQLVTNRAVRFDSAGAVQTYVRASGDINATAQQLQQLGATVDGMNAQMGVVQAWINPALLGQITGLPAVQNVDLPDYAVSNVTTLGDTVHLTDQVRTKFAAQGFTGAGVKVGVISDGVNHRANVGAAELPAITVDPTHPGNGDEGTAMLEIVHDLAPDAQLYFSGPSTSLDMVQCINYLKNQGCDVIIDDVSFFGEHFFSDGPVAAAAESAVASGVAYFTSSGNYSNQQHYQGNFVQGQSAFGGGRLHRFGGPGEEVNQVNIPNGSRFRAFLQWSDEYGASTNDYDLYLYNGDTIAQLDASTGLQNGNDAPLEFVDWTNNTGGLVHGQLWVVKKDLEAVRELEIFTIGNSFMEFSTVGDALIGQQAAPNVASIAAVNAASPNTAEVFSSRGGSTIYTNFATQTKTVRQTLDGTAVDGVQTKVGQLGFFSNPFFGTSAASPHAGAIAALVLQAKPSATPAQVLAIMADTATDLGTGGYDTTYGAGRYNALNAVYKAYTPAAPDMKTASDTGVSNTDNITADNTTGLVGTTPAGSFVELFIDGAFHSFVNQAAGVGTWEINTAALSNGQHTATIRVCDDNTVPVANRSAFSAPLMFVVDTVGLSLPATSFAYETDHSLGFDFNEDVSQSMSAGDLELVNLTTGQPIDPALLSFNFEGGINVASFTALGSLPDGNYTGTINASAVTDIAGNPMTGPAVNAFFVLSGDANRDRSVDIGDFSILAANFNAPGAFSDGDFNYDALVDIGDFSTLAAKFNTSFAAPADLPRAIGSATPAQSTFGQNLIGAMELIEELSAA